MQPVTWHDYMALQRRANAHAEDITEHGQRIEALFNDSGLHAEHIGELVHRIEALEGKQEYLWEQAVTMVNSLTVRAGVYTKDVNELTRRIEANVQDIGTLRGMLSAWAGRVEAEHDKLNARIGRLERLLERED